MKNKLLYIGLTSLFLFGCSKKNEEIDYLSIKSKIENKEDFIFTISSDKCHNCINLVKNYNKSKYNFTFYEIDLITIDEGITNNDSFYIDSYKYLVDLTLYSYSNVKNSLTNETYNDYLLLNYDEWNGKNSYIEGYVDLVTPLSFFVVDGKIEDFVIGDWSEELDAIMENYSNKVGMSNEN